jgi:hypothetical protein
VVCVLTFRRGIVGYDPRPYVMEAGGAPPADPLAEPVPPGRSKDPCREKRRKSWQAPDNLSGPGGYAARSIASGYLIFFFPLALILAPFNRNFKPSAAAHSSDHPRPRPLPPTARARCWR